MIQLGMWYVVVAKNGRWSRVGTTQKVNGGDKKFEGQLLDK